MFECQLLLLLLLFLFLLLLLLLVYGRGNKRRPCRGVAKTTRYLLVVMVILMVENIGIHCSDIGSTLVVPGNLELLLLLLLIERCMTEG